MKNNVLITGGAGFIGSVLTRKLLERNCKVTIVDNFMFNQDSLLSLCYDKNLEIITGDVRDSELISTLLGKNDIVIPLAALVGAPLCDKFRHEAEDINYESIKFIANQKSNDQLLLFPNTNSGYGISDISNPCTEESPLNPISLYGETKVRAEQSIQNDSDNWVIFRLATVFGVSPKMRLDLLVNDFTYRAWRDGFIVLYEKDFKRNYVYIGDVAEAFIWAIENFSDIKNNVFNLGLSDANLSKAELCSLIKKHIPKFEIFNAEYNQDVDKRNYIVSNTKIENAGFCAKTSIDEGIEELMKAFLTMSIHKYSNV